MARKQVKYSSVIIPKGMKEIALAHDRSLASEAKVAMEEYVRRFREKKLSGEEK